MSTRLSLAALALVALTRPAPAALESICPQCGHKAPAFLAGLKCYHCGATLPKLEAQAQASPAPSATPVPAHDPAHDVGLARPAGPPLADLPEVTPARAAKNAPQQAPRVGGLELPQPPVWYAARLPTSNFEVRPPAAHEKVEREVQIPADGLAPAATARAGSPTAIPLPGPYAAIAITAEHRGAESSPGLIYIEAKLADGTWWSHTMKVAPAAGAATLCAFWPPAPFTELRLSGLDSTGTFAQGSAMIQTLQVQP